MMINEMMNLTRSLTSEWNSGADLNIAGKSDLDIHVCHFFLVFGALSLFDKILLLLSFLFLHFNRVNWVIVDTLDLFGPSIC